MNRDDVRAVAGDLRDYATHFSERDWCYTRDLGDLAAIRYASDFDRARSRFRRAVGYLLRGCGGGGLRVPRWAMIRHTCLRRDRHLPDGVLNGGNIITHWEEDGEYLQYVQPTVGALIAEWLDDQPDNPHAVRVAAEMRRIQDDYAARLAAVGDEEDET